MSSGEALKTPDRKNRFLGAWKNFNKVSAVVLASAGVVFEQSALLGLAAIDVVQNMAINRFEQWRGRHKTVRGLGKTAIAGA